MLHRNVQLSCKLPQARAQLLLIVPDLHDWTRVKQDLALILLRRFRHSRGRGVIKGLSDRLQANRVLARIGSQTLPSKVLLRSGR